MTKARSKSQQPPGDPSMQPAIAPVRAGQPPADMPLMQQAPAPQIARSTAPPAPAVMKSGDGDDAAGQLQPGSDALPGTSDAGQLVDAAPVRKPDPMIVLDGVTHLPDGHLLIDPCGMLGEADEIVFMHLPAA